MSGPALAATSATGQGYGLNVTANIAGVGLGVPLADTGPQTAPSDFNASQSVASANISAGALLQVGTGVINGTAQSALAQNSVQSTGSVDGLNLGLLGALNLSVLKVTADAVGSTAQMSCVAGSPVATGSSTLANLKIVGPLGVNIPVVANPGANTSIGVPGVATITLNEQISTATSITVNALHININVLGLITADVVVGHSVAAMPNCQAAPNSVTISAPNITAANAGAVPVTGACTAGGGTVNVTSNPSTPPTGAACSAAKTYVASVNASAVADGSVQLTATQDSVFASTTVNKSTVVGVPSVTVGSLSTINAANRGAYGPVSGTCSAVGSPVVVAVGTVSVTPSPVCTAPGNWTSGVLDLTALPDGPVTVNASQTNVNGTGSGSASTTKDATLPVVQITAGPAINSTNVTAYSTSGTCTAGDGTVSVLVGGIPASGPCNAGSWTVSGLNVSSLPQGPVQITASQTDAAGNTGNATRATSKDTVGPVVTVTAPAQIDAGNQAAYSVSGTCTTGDGSVTVTIGSLVTTAPCNAGIWTVSGLNVSSLPQGTVPITATQTDAAGNTGSGSGSANKTTPATADTTPPVVTVTAPPIDAGNQNTYSPSGTCTAGDGSVTVTIGTPPNAVVLTATCGAGGTWTAPPTNVSALPIGPVTVTASQTDAAGNTGTGQVTTTKLTNSTPSSAAVPVPVGGSLPLLLLLSGAAFLRLRKYRRSN